MKKPMTTEELFNKICSILKERGKMPDILDYGLATHDPIPIKTYEFKLKNNLDYGASEGIYLDLWIEYFEEEKRRTSELGTFKTLYSSNEAMHVMAKLLSDFIIEESDYVDANIDDFTWTGVDVRASDENGKSLNWCYSCSNMESALERKDDLLKKYPQVVIRDNVTRRERIFRREIKEREGMMDTGEV